MIDNLSGKYIVNPPNYPCIRIGSENNLFSHFVSMEQGVGNEYPGKDFTEIEFLEKFLQ